MTDDKKQKPEDAEAPEPEAENVAEQVAEVIDNPAETVVEQVEKVEEVIDEHTPKETPIERGIDTIMARLDVIEEKISSIVKPEPKTEPEPEPKPKPKKEATDGPQKQIAVTTRGGGKKISIFRKRG